MGVSYKKFKEPIKLFYMECVEDEGEFRPGVSNISFVVKSVDVKDMEEVGDLFEKLPSSRKAAFAPGDYRDMPGKMNIDRQLLMALLGQSDLIEE